MVTIYIVLYEVVAQLHDERDKLKLENQALQAQLKDSIQQITGSLT